MSGCGALVHAMPVPTELLPCVKGLNFHNSTNHRSQPLLSPTPATILSDIGKNAAVLPSRQYYSVAVSVAVLTVTEPATL